jgi:hypothetical protein
MARERGHRLASLGFLARLQHGEPPVDLVQTGDRVGVLNRQQRQHE